VELGLAPGTTDVVLGILEKKFIFFVKLTSTKKQGKKLQNLLIRKFEFVAKTQFPKKSYSYMVTKQH